MATPPSSRPPMAGGFLIAAAVLIGAIAGVMLRQPSAGVVVGAVVGVALAALIWVRDKRRG